MEKIKSKYLLLTELPRNIQARIHEINHPKELAQRLIGMGVMKGTLLERLNDSFPSIIKIAGYRLGMDYSIANNIMVYEINPLEVK